MKQSKTKKPAHKPQPPRRKLIQTPTPLCMVSAWKLHGKLDVAPSTRDAHFAVAIRGGVGQSSTA